MNRGQIQRFLVHAARAGTRAVPWPGRDRLEAAYAYDASTPPAVSETVRPDPEYQLSRLAFTKPGGEAHSGLFLRPRAEGVYPVAVLLHALSRDKEHMIRLFGRPLAAQGVASLALDAHLHGERHDSRTGALGPLEYLELVRESIVEYRQALDYLLARPDVDPSRVGLLGYSLGAMMGTILAGLDRRIGACALMVAGDMVRSHLEQVPAPLRPLLDDVSPAAYAPRISPRPVLFLNGREDARVPRAAAEILHQAAREPKEIVWVDSGHHLPASAGQYGVDWLVARLTG